jgi:hypothetical protein
MVQLTYLIYEKTLLLPHYSFDGTQPVIAKIVKKITN